MKTETIFFATFTSSDGNKRLMHDRRQYFDEEKSLKEFHDWIEKRKLAIEKLTLGRNVMVTNIQFIKNQTS